MSGQIHAEDTFVACSIAHNPTPYDHVYQISCVAPYWSLLQLKFCVFFYPPLHPIPCSSNILLCVVSMFYIWCGSVSNVCAWNSFTGLVNLYQECTIECVLLYFPKACCSNDNLKQKRLFISAQTHIDIIIINPTTNLNPILALQNSGGKTQALCSAWIKDCK